LALSATIGGLSLCLVMCSSANAAEQLSAQEARKHIGETRIVCGAIGDNAGPFQLSEE
jgi:hypothetical protein